MYYKRNDNTYLYYKLYLLQIGKVVNSRETRQFVVMSNTYVMSLRSC